MFLSIVIPCYNVGKYLQRTLDSIKSQLRKLEYEIIIVDDGSIDNTLEVAEKGLAGVANFKIITKENGGVSSARNVGLRYAIGEYLLFLDGDDVVLPDLFSNLCVSLEEFDVISWGFIEEVAKDKKRCHLIKNYQSEQVLSSFLYGINKLWIGSILFRRNFIISNNLLFNEQTSYGEDREFIARSLLYSNKTFYIRSLLSVYKWREESAMRVVQKYSAKRFTSVLAAERVFNLVLNDSHSKSMAALTNLIITVIEHKIIILKEENSQFNEIIDNYIKEYLPKYKLHILCRYSIIVYVLKLLYKINNRFLDILLRVVS